MANEKTGGVAASPNPRMPVQVVAIAAILVLAWYLADVILLAFGSVIVATALRALAMPLHRRLRLSPRLAVTVAVLLALLAFGLTGWLIGDRVVEQTAALRQRLPEALDALQRWLLSHHLGNLLVGWDSAQAKDIPWGKLANFASRALGALGAAALVIIIGIYLAADPRLYRQGLVRLVPVSRRPLIEESLTASGHALTRWLLGQAISMLFVGSATAIGLALLGMPMALSLGLIAGMLAFIPFLGAIAAGLLAVVLAFSQGPELALHVALLSVLIQQIEGHVLVPLVQRWAVSLPPVLSILAGVIFGLLFGVMGVMFAAPLMIVVMVLLRKLYIEAILEAPAAPGQRTA